MSSSRKTWRALGASVLIVAFALLAAWRKGGLRWLESHARPVPAAREEPVATLAELAVVAPIRAGSKLGGWTVESISRTLHGVFRVVLVRDGKHVVLAVSLVGHGPPNPPCVAAPYTAYYYSSPGGHDADDVAFALTRALCAVVEKNRSVPPPPDLLRGDGPAAGSSSSPSRR